LLVNYIELTLAFYVYLFNFIQLKPKTGFAFINSIVKRSQQFSDLTVHVVLATMPQRQEGIFDKCIIEHFYGNYRD
jgi:hypothetical protein